MTKPLASSLLAFVACAACAASSGCASGSDLPSEHHESDPASSGEVTGTAEQALTSVTRSDAVATAELWAAAKLQYCQAPNGAHDDDTACASTCTRTRNAAWDPYRSDCSGLISWAWGLPAPGRVTSQFAPFNTVVSSTIACADLKPGDAANRNAVGHIVLFKGWITPGKKAVFIEEPGCSSSEPYAHDFTSDVTCSGNDIDIAYEGETFTAIRFDAIVDDPPAADAGAAGDGGSTSDASVVSSDPQGNDAGGDVVDSDKNVTPPPDGSSGCTLAATSARGHSPATLWVFALAALGLVARRRREPKRYT